MDGILFDFGRGAGDNYGEWLMSHRSLRSHRLLISRIGIGAAGGGE